jgi:hypothetical protein
MIEEIMLRVCELLMPGSKPPVEDFPWLRCVALLKLTRTRTLRFDSYRFIPDFMTNWKARSRKIGGLMDKLYGGA